VGIVFGYPSYLREIQYAVKRASDENVLNKRNLKSAPIPVTDSQKPANLATYRYFAASKYSKNLEAAVDFLVHLADKNSQAAYISAFPYYLPASNELVDARKDQSVDKDFPRVKYESFLPTEGEKVVAFDGGFPTEYRDFFTSFDLVGKTPATLISDLDDMQKCLRRHLIEGANFEESCKK
jgi:ABC-type glycerol-3-phosphate transport system substrate-binding protein